MKEFWNERYAEPEFAYGVLPNDFFKNQLDKLKPGSIHVSYQHFVHEGRMG